MQDQREHHQAHMRALWARLVEETDARRWSEADRLFNEARAYAKANDMAFMDLHVLYARHLTALGEHERTVPHLDFLRGVYEQVGVTDASFLGLRGVPTFATYLGLVQDHLTARPDDAARARLLETLIDRLDAEGRAAAREMLEALGASRAGG